MAIETRRSTGKRLFWAVLMYAMVLASVAVVLYVHTLAGEQTLFSKRTFRKLTNLLIDEDEEEKLRGKEYDPDVVPVVPDDDDDSLQLLPRRSGPIDPRDASDPWHPYVLTDVFDQGKCGSCASVSVATMIADRHNLTNPTTTTTVTLSVQSLLDALDRSSCERSDGETVNDKCVCGAWPFATVERALQHGVAKEGSCDLSSYRAAEHPACPHPNCCFQDATIQNNCSRIGRDWDWSWTLSEEDAEQMLRTGGTIMAIIASNILNGPEGYGLKEILTESELPALSDSDKLGPSNHAVCIVGVTSTHWIVRNSWSKRAHKDGFVLLPKGVNALGLGIRDFTRNLFGFFVQVVTTK